MTDENANNGGSERDSSDFAQRLKHARQARDTYKAAREPKLRSENSGFGQAFRIGAELISALLVGVGIGWGLDELLGTKPWLMITFIFLGGAAGILNVYRTAMRMVEDENIDAAGAKADPSNAGAEKGDASSRPATHDERER